MGASLGQGAVWVMPAVPSVVSQLRRHAAAFAAAAGASEEVTDGIALAVSETVTNVIVHAYEGEEEGEVRVRCDVDDERVIVEVVDYGSGIAARHDSPGIGHGLATVGGVAQSLDIPPGPDGRGTVVTMSFGRVQPLSAPPGLEGLCAVALETVADVSSVHLAREGVLRRVAAEVAGEPSLSAWLRDALP